MWVRWSASNSTLLQPIFSVRVPSGSPLLSFSGSNNGSLVSTQFSGPTPTGRGAGVATKVTGTAPLLSGAGWTHLVLVWDNSVPSSIEVSVYINASLAAQHSISTTGISGISGTEFDIGGSQYAASNTAVAFSGHMDELMAFSAPLNQAQVTQLFLYNLPYDVAPEYPLGVLVRAPVIPSYTACDLVNANQVTHTVLITTTTTTNTTFVQSGVANRTTSISTTSVQQLKWSVPWSPDVYAAFASYPATSVGQPTVNTAEYSNCTNATSSVSSVNPVCPAYSPALLQQLSLLNATNGTQVLAPFLVDSTGAFLSPYRYFYGLTTANAVVLPAGVVNTTFAAGKGTVVASPLPRLVTLTQAYSNGDVLFSNTATSTPAQLSIINSTIEVVEPGTLSIDTTQVVLYMTSGVNVTAPLSSVIAYAVPDSTTSDQTDPSWPIIIQLGPQVQISSNVFIDGTVTIQTVTIEQVTLTITETSAVTIDSSVSTALQQSSTTTTTPTGTTPATTVSRTPVAYNYTHVIYSSSSLTQNDSTTQTATLGQTLTNINFQDNSTVAISGQVTFAPNTATPGVQYCGVEGIVVQAYALSDTAFSNPLSSSPPTGVDGIYVLGVTSGQQLVLVATFEGNRSLHTFSPANVTVTVSHTPIVGVSFQDTTTQDVILSIVGGMCAIPIGYVTPVLVLESCGGVHIPLPSFSNFPEQYRLPAFPSATIFGYTADSQDNSGLQVPDPPNSAQAAYAAQVNAWLIQNAQLQLNLSISGANVSFVYTSDTTITLNQPMFATLPCSEQEGSGPRLGYDVQQTGQPYLLEFQLSQTYGVAGIRGVLNSTTCGNIDPSLIQLWVHDELSDDAANPCVATGCALPPVYNPVSRQSTVEYTTTFGVPYIFSRYPAAPDYTRDLRYGISGTFDEEINVLSVLVTGSLAYQGVSEIIVPPQNTAPLYILRRPPGGASMATYTSTITVTATVTNDHNSQFEENAVFMIGAGFNYEEEICELFGFGEELGLCDWSLTINLELDYTNTLDIQSNTDVTIATTTVVSYSQSFTTTNDQFTVDGAGDALLLIAASLNQSLSTTVTVVVPPGGPVLNLACQASVFDTPTAQYNPANSLVWIDVDQIQAVEIYEANMLMQSLQTENGGSTLFSNPQTQLAYYEAADSIAAWNQLLNYKAALEASALPWPELVETVAFGNASSAAVDLASPGELDSNTVVLTYQGDSAPVTFTVMTSYTSDNTTAMGNQLSDANEVNLQSINQAATIYLDFQLTSTTTTTNTYTMTYEINQEQDTQLIITLADPDLHDQFSVAILKDPVYGSPVYVTQGGQSRCTPEAGTVAREYITMSLNTDTFVQVPPTARLSTTLTINQASPFQETFAYLLNVDIQSNVGGLVIEADGIVVSHNNVELTLPYGATDVQLVMYRDDGSGFSYQDVGLVLSSADCTVGHITLFEYAQETSTYAVTSFSVEFIPQCAAVSFAGALDYSNTFVVNAATDGYFTFTINNPDYYVGGQSWEALLAAGTLQNITAQYKPSAANTAEWETVPTYNNVPFAPLSSPLTEDYYAFTADLSQLPPGQYDFRLVAQCAQPGQDVEDPSLYQTISSVVTGTVDLTGPDVLTYQPGVQPGGSISTYLPGDEISVSFTEEIVCTGTAGSLHAVALYSASETALAAALQGGASVSQNPLVTYCEDNKITLNFLRPLWTELVGQYVAVQVGGFTDVAGNPIDPIYGQVLTWAFQVGQFDATDLTVTVENLQLTAQPAVIAVLFSLGQPSSVSSSTGGAGRRLLAQANDTQVAGAVEFSLSLTSMLSAGTKAAAAAQFETQLQQQMQLEVTQLITSYWAANNRTLSPTDFYPSQVALDNVQTKPVSFDIVLLPAAAATISPAEAAHAFVSAMEAVVLAGPGSLPNTTYPLLSLQTLKAVTGLDGTLMSPLIFTISTPLALADAVVPSTIPTVSSASTVSNNSSGVMASSTSSYHYTSSSSGSSSPSSSTSSTATHLAGWLWPALCGLLALLLVLVTVAFASQSAAMRRVSGQKDSLDINSATAVA